MSMTLPALPASMTLPSLPTSMTLPSIEPGTELLTMLVEQAIHLLLIRDVGVSALVSARVYEPFLPQTCVYPAIALRLTGAERIDQLGNRNSTGLVRSSFNIFSTTRGPSNYGEAKRVDKAVRLALQGYRGFIHSQDLLEDVYVQGIFPVSTYDFYDDTTQTHQIVSAYDVWASEEQPTVN